MIDVAALDPRVEALMRAVGREVVMPHFRALGPADIAEKTPGDLVTIADRLAEERLSDGLCAILPGARVIGEEAVDADPSLLDEIGTGLAWTVDPIDGTNNYAAGRSPFAIMIGLVQDGETLGGWILDPASGRLLRAARGRGATIDGVAVRSRGSGVVPPLGALAMRYFPPEQREAFRARMDGRIAEVPIPHCAGEQYPRLVEGANDIALFWRTQPWDHVPGALFLTEAGGRIARFDGTPYRVGQGGPGLIAAATPELWSLAAAILTG